MRKKIKIKKRKRPRRTWKESIEQKVGTGGGRAVEEGDKVSLKKIDKNKRRLNIDKKSEEGAKLHICVQKLPVQVKKFQFDVCFFAIVKEG